MEREAVLPDLRFGDEPVLEDNQSLPEMDDEEDNDELLSETPTAVVDILGFDPLDEE